MPKADPARTQLNKILKQIESLRETLDGEDLEQALAPLLRRGQEYQARLEGGGAIAQGDGAVAVGEGGMYVGGNYTVHVDSSGRDDEKINNKARLRYLRNLRKFCHSLPLAALGGEEDVEEEITLDRVYIELDTTIQTTAKQLDILRKAGNVVLEDIYKELYTYRELPGVSSDSDDRNWIPLPLLDAVSFSTHVVILGEPGAGKSTFVKKLVALQAAALLGECEHCFGINPELTPVLVILRDLAPRLSSMDIDGLPVEHQRKLMAEAMQAHIVDGLAQYKASDYAGDLAEQLDAGRILLVLDGLDEVPYNVRLRVRQAVGAVLNQREAGKIIITCRTRSYAGKIVLPGLRSLTIAPFDQKKISNFVQGWYNAQVKLGRLTNDQAGKRAGDLVAAATAPDLVELSSNPMMLTSMAIIHQKEIGLPRERVRLYSLVVDVLLRRWQKHKVGDDALATFIKDDLRLRATVERLAYEAQRTSSKVDGEDVDLPRGRALELLEKEEYLGSTSLASDFLDYVDQRAGLLVGRGGDDENRPAAYSFPHRTFQEYLAGCHLAGQRDLARFYLKHAGEGDLWNLAALLGAEELFFNRRNINTLLDLAYYLCGDAKPKNEAGQRALLWSGQIARLLGLDTVQRDTGSPDGGGKYLRRLLPRLVALFDSPLSPSERVEAGRVLGKLGDPRLEVTHSEKIVFCFVPSGKFTMGDGQETCQVFLSDYWMSRSPVTNAQFHAFMKDDGYQNEEFWIEASNANAWKNGKIIRRENTIIEADGEIVEKEATWQDCPIEYGEPYNLPNHPVVGVSWYEALAFSRWMEKRFRETGLFCVLHEKGPVRFCEEFTINLPSEAEWEKSGRGLDERIFPWGDQFNPRWANTQETGISSTSVVGCFPEGASSIGLLDLSGNVWEWTRSLYREYPYKPDDGREDLRLNGTRVMRGGAFNSNRGYARCAYRLAYKPDAWHRGIGFRIVLSTERSGALSQRME